MFFIQNLTSILTGTTEYYINTVSGESGIERPATTICMFNNWVDSMLWELILKDSIIFTLPSLWNLKSKKNLKAKNCGSMR